MDKRPLYEPEVVASINARQCPICGGKEGCDHTVPERLRAFKRRLPPAEKEGK